MFKQPSQGLANYHRSVKRVLVGIMLLNLAVTAITFAAGALTGSVAILADALNSLVDSSSNVVGLLGMRVASEPPDPDHPYGHRKYETIATLGIGGLMLVAGWEVVQDIFKRLTSGELPTVTPLALGLILLTLPINAWVVWYEGKRGFAATGSRDHSCGAAGGEGSVISALPQLYLCPWLLDRRLETECQVEGRQRKVGLLSNLAQ